MQVVVATHVQHFDLFQQANVIGQPRYQNMKLTSSIRYWDDRQWVSSASLDKLASSSGLSRNQKPHVLVLECPLGPGDLH